MSRGAPRLLRDLRRGSRPQGQPGLRLRRPALLAVCDGVGGAARGDIASSTAVAAAAQARRDPPGRTPTSDLLGQVAGALHRAHDRIAELVDEDPALNGTSTTATVALFDGTRVGIGHVGDSRAYLYRDGELASSPTTTPSCRRLIDEGRITEEESRVHPHRNLILKASTASTTLEPDLFDPRARGRRPALLCSDGACGVLDDDRLADILASGTPDYAAVELVRASLEAGSTDNVTCLVADVVEDDAADDADPARRCWSAPPPTCARRRAAGGAKSGSLFRGHRSGDTGELEPVRARSPTRAPSRSPATRSTPRRSATPRAPRAATPG